MPMILFKTTLCVSASTRQRIRTIHLQKGRRSWMWMQNGHCSMKDEEAEHVDGEGASEVEPDIRHFCFVLEMKSQGSTEDFRKD